MARHTVPRPAVKRRTLLLIVLLLAAGGAAPANAKPTLYIAQSAAGAGDGSSCLSPRPASYFNTPANWGVGKPIAPGATVAVCGTVTSTLTAQGSGAAGSPVTVAFQPGAKISQPACSPCLNLS